MVKPYQTIPIQPQEDPLIPIPANLFPRVTPHPYVAAGADYGGRSPYFLRRRVLTKLIEAQDLLQRSRPDLQLQIFDAYRPIAVQQFMVNYTFAQLKGDRHLTPLETKELWQQVYQFWAVPSEDPATPPPHSTGAAIDLTLITRNGEPVPMGGDIDDIGDYSYPDFYQMSPNPIEQRYHSNRQLLRQAMEQAGFVIHPNEWWHFSYGDQLWAWQTHQAIAHYGRI
ncbi:M15 family metallopeptidase [Picosynechococcus sp. NKBG15041c]|uniref:M15 family metallopeptidase n=1 Tax=Picosynechococcus sp. NKBG15041c TaxID=1407650 RepID=UPI000417DC89|nr:M15 family metallopeptidase [Picosynechococcus sp. NKBG15041c]